MVRINQKRYNYIIIKSDSLVFLSNENQVFSYYSSYGLFARGFRKIIKKINFHNILPFFYNGWKRNLEKCDLVILFDGGIDDVNRASGYIKKNNPCLKLIFWYWNPVKPSDTALSDDCIDEIWTYNRFDAKKYNLKYNPQFYSKMKIPSKLNSNVDMIFMGGDKGRRAILEKLRKTAMAQGLNCRFAIVGKKRDRVDYDDYLSMLMRSKCVIDIVSNQFCGLTLRPLEALFYEKKLITNYEDIVNYDFYDKENIFVLGKDDINMLAEFVNSPYKKIDKKIVDFYSYENWLKRIERGESIEP